MEVLRLVLLLPVVLVLLHASIAERELPPPAQRPPPLPRVAEPHSTGPAPGARAPSVPTPSELLAQRKLAVPVQGVPRARLQDTFGDSRSRGRQHKAIDIMAPWGTPVLAADDGRIAKISRNRGGGLSLYQVDGSGRFVYYYAHLAGYADNLREGQPIRRGDVIGYVGTTGNAPDSAPHLHFAVMVLQAEKRWWGGEAVNPYEALMRGDPQSS
jgi:murein DD-endopeptidase MepM/ murein hydrolase activator NlpD